MYKRLNNITKDVSEKFALLAADIFFGPRLAKAHEDRMRRVNALKRIDNCNEGGKVAVIESGRDCDGVEYGNNVRLVDASIKAVEEHMDYHLAGADGPMYFEIRKPSEAKQLQSWSRDRGMEAFEDGHSHMIYSTM